MGKRITIAFLSIVAFLLFIACVLAGFVINKMHEKKYSREALELIQELEAFEKVINSGNYDDLSLTIYHTSPYGERERLSASELKEYVSKQENDMKDSIYREYITGEELKENVDLLKRINSDTVKLRGNTYWSVDTRIYYEFKHKDEVILKVALWGYPRGKWPKYNGSNASAIINGRFEVKGTEVFCEVIMPYLHEDDAKNLHDFVKGTLPDFMIEQIESEDTLSATASY